MSQLNDSLTVGILLLLIFGAVCFYLYSKMVQNEKRVSLLENLLVSLKMSTEASLGGPDSVEAVSGPLPLDGVDNVEEENYEELLKDIPVASVKEDKLNTSPSTQSASGSMEEDAAVQEAEALLRSVSAAPVLDANYESMTVKELQGLAKQRGLTGIAARKRDLIDALKRQGMPPPAAPKPLDDDGIFPAPTGEGEEGISLEEM